MISGVFSTIQQRDHEAPLDRPARRGEVERGVEEEAVDDVACAIPVGEHLALGRADPTP